MQHLNDETALRYIEMLRKKAKILLFTNDIWPVDRVNVKIDNGGWRAIRLDLAPFSMAGGSILMWDVYDNAGCNRKSTFILYGENGCPVDLLFNKKPRFKFTIVACARWENNYIAEWLNYYRAIGFDHVFLYCNDDDPTALFEKVLPFTLGLNPFVTFRFYPIRGNN